MATQQDVIKSFMQTLNNTTLKGGEALNEAIRVSSGYRSNLGFKNFAAVKKKFLADMKAAKNWHTFLVEKCGIILDNADTGAISGSDAGGTTKTATDILPSTGTAQYPENQRSFTIEGLTIYGIPARGRLTADQQYVVQGLYSWWVNDALTLIKESYGFSFEDNGTTNARLKLEFINDPDNDALAYVSYDNIDGDTAKVYESRALYVNMAHLQNMSANDNHGTTDGLALDRVLIHELVHSIMASNVDYFNNLPDFLREGGSADLIHGLDDINYDEIVSYAKDPSIFENILKAKPLSDPTDEIFTGGYIFMRYYAKQASTYTKFDYDVRHATVSVEDSVGGFATNYHDTVTMLGGARDDTLTNSGFRVSIYGGQGNDTIKTYTATVTVEGGEGNDFILNEGNRVTIYGGNGNDSITNEGNRVSILGDAGTDEISNFGSSVSVDGGEGGDLIQNSFADYKKGKSIKSGATTTNGATLKAADGESYKVTLSGGSASSLSGGAGVDSVFNGASNATIYGNADGDSITNYGFNAVVDGGEGNDYILNTSNTSAFGDDTIITTGYNAKLYGGEGNDSIENYSERVSIYGGAGDDSVRNYGGTVSLSGGEDNDALLNFGEKVTLNGNAGDDELNNYGNFSFVLGENGNDTLYNSGEGASLSGGLGTDYLINDGVNSSVIGGRGNDTIENYGDHVTLAGGKGNDSIINTGEYVAYEFGEDNGKDTVVGFHDNDTVKITTESEYSIRASGNDVIVQIDTATMRLVDAAGQLISVIESNGREYQTRAPYYNTAWFLDDDNNFSDNQLSELVESKDYLPNVQLDTSNNLFKETQLITYSNKK